MCSQPLVTAITAPMFIVFYRYLRGWQQVPPHGRGRWIRRKATVHQRRKQGASGFLGSHQGLQSALHPLPRHRHRTEFSHRSCHQAPRSASLTRSLPPPIPILVLSGGEPLYRSDIFQLARYATDKGLRVALATNGTLVTKDVARMIVDAGVRRVSISLDGADAPTHDAFRGIPGAFDAAVHGLAQSEGARHVGADQYDHRASQRASTARCSSVGPQSGRRRSAHLPAGPVGCGVDIAAEQMVPPEEYERMLNWFYDQSLTGGIELKATCAPHYFRVARQRRAADRRAAAATDRHLTQTP